MTDPSPLTAEQTVELRKLLDKSVPDTSTEEQLYWHAMWRNRVLQYLLALLALAERPSNGECEAMAKRLSIYADLLDDNHRDFDSQTIREAAALLRKLSAGESGGWQPIESAPKDGTKIDLWCVPPESRGYSIGVRLSDCQWRGDDSGWGFLVHSVKGIDWEYVERDGPVFPAWTPIYWMPLPEPPK